MKHLLLLSTILIFCFSCTDKEAPLLSKIRSLEEEIKSLREQNRKLDKEKSEFMRNLVECQKSTARITKNNQDKIIRLKRLNPNQKKVIKLVFGKHQRNMEEES